MKKILFGKNISLAHIAGAFLLVFALAIVAPIMINMTKVDTVSGKRPTPVPTSAPVVPPAVVPVVPVVPPDVNGHKDDPDPCIALGTCTTGDKNGKGQPINGSLHASCKAQGEVDPLCVPVVPTLPPPPVIPTATPGGPTPTPGGPGEDNPETSVEVAAQAPQCPVIKAVGFVGDKVVFNTLYTLISPAGNTWSFGDLRVDKVVFVPSEKLFLEETGAEIDNFTWEPKGAARFEELRFREIPPEATCKVRFLFGSLNPTPTPTATPAN